MSDGGKGSAPRPVEVPRDEFNRRWEETFGKKGCTRSHPHEDMSSDCERLTVEAREANRLANLKGNK